MEIHALGLMHQTTGTSESHREGMTGAAMISPVGLSLSLRETDRRRARGKSKERGQKRMSLSGDREEAWPSVGLVFGGLAGGSFGGSREKSAADAEQVHWCWNLVVITGLDRVPVV
jgi:hypothetical protein